MRTLTIFCLLSFASLTFGQKAEKMDRNAAAQAWAAISFPLPPDTPPITGGGLVKEVIANDSSTSRKVWFPYSKLGDYMMRGNTCDGDEVKLGGLSWEPGPYNQTGLNLIFDGITQPTFPSMSPTCTVEVVRIYKGTVERSMMNVNPWQPAAPGFQFGSEGTKDGRYSVTMTPLPADAVVILGRSVIATEIQRSPTSSIAIFPLANVPPIGLTTLTVCSKGGCNTITFERKMEMPTSGSGKG